MLIGTLNHMYDIVAYTFTTICKPTAFTITEDPVGGALPITTMTYPSVSCTGGTLCEKIDIDTSSPGFVEFFLDVTPNESATPFAPQKVRLEIVCPTSIVWDSNLMAAMSFTPTFGGTTPILIDITGFVAD